MTFVMMRFEIYWFDYFYKNIQCVIYLYLKWDLSLFCPSYVSARIQFFDFAVALFCFNHFPFEIGNFKQCWVSFFLWTWIELILKLDSDSTVWYQFIRSDFFFSPSKDYNVKHGRNGMALNMSYIGQGEFHVYLWVSC